MGSELNKMFDSKVGFSNPDTPVALPGETLAQYAMRTAAQTGFSPSQLAALLGAASAQGGDQSDPAAMMYQFLHAPKPTPADVQGWTQAGEYQPPTGNYNPPPPPPPATTTTQPPATTGSSKLPPGTIVNQGTMQEGVVTSDGNIALKPVIHEGDTTKPPNIPYKHPAFTPTAVTTTGKPQPQSNLNRSGIGPQLPPAEPTFMGGRDPGIPKTIYPRNTSGLPHSGGPVNPYPAQPLAYTPGGPQTDIGPKPAQNPIAQIGHALALNNPMGQSPTEDLAKAMVLAHLNELMSSGQSQFPTPPPPK